MEEKKRKKLVAQFFPNWLGKTLLLKFLHERLSDSLSFNFCPKTLLFCCLNLTVSSKSTLNTYLFFLCSVFNMTIVTMYGTNKLFLNPI